MVERDDLIAQYIEALKAQVGAETDSDLARLLSVDKRTVSAWRSRKSVPERFLAMLHGKSRSETGTPAMQMSEYDSFAFSLALFRFVRAKASVATGGNFRDTWDAFRFSAGFWLLMREAKKEINTLLRDRATNLETAFTLALHDDLADPEGTMKRDRAVVSNPFQRHTDKGE